MERHEVVQCNKTKEFIESDKPFITLPGNYYTSTYGIRTFPLAFDSSITDELPIQCPICHEEFKIIVKPGRIKPKEEAEKEFKKVRSYGWIQMVGGIAISIVSIYIFIMREIYVLPSVASGDIVGFLMLMLIGLIFVGLLLISRGNEQIKKNIHDIDFEYDMVRIVGKDYNNNHSFYRVTGGRDLRGYHPSSNKEFFF
jgi:hypothetical protein